MIGPVLEALLAFSDACLRWFLMVVVVVVVVGNAGAAVTLGAGVDIFVAGLRWFLMVVVVVVVVGNAGAAAVTLGAGRCCLCCEDEIISKFQIYEFDCFVC